MRISDWSSDVCSSDLAEARGEPEAVAVEPVDRGVEVGHAEQRGDRPENLLLPERGVGRHVEEQGRRGEGVRSIGGAAAGRGPQPLRPDGPKGRTGERRGGEEDVSKCKSRWAPQQSK